MKPKVIVTIALLCFVGISLAAMIVKETRSEPTPVAASTPEPEAGAAIEEAAETEESHFVVYYFHGDVRCQTCNAIETQSHEAITGMFDEQLASGEMEWRLVNYDRAENAHFREDFELAFQSVVLVEERGDEVLRWENLADVWTKIHEDPQEFEEYVIQSTVDFMAEDAS